MKKIYHKLVLPVKISACLLGGVVAFSGCEKGLEYKSYGDLSSVVGTKEGAQAEVNAIYKGLAGGSDWQGGWDAGTYAWRTQAMMTTDEGVCAWGGNWIPLRNLNYNPDFDWVTHNYTRYMPYLSQIAITLADVDKASIDADLKKRYIGELKGLRAHFAEMLYFNYGPITIVTDAQVAANPYTPYVPRPTSDVVVAQIEKDYQDAAASLPNKFTGQDYGRFSKGAALTGLMKLYMHEKSWAKAVATGQAITQLGYTLTPNYEDNFNINNKAGKSSEIILAVVCSPTGGDQFTNMWLAHSLPSDYKDSTGIPLTAWGGYKMPWTSYDKFDKADKRLKVLLESYPVDKTADGKVIYKNARTAGQLGAVPMKFGPDPSKASSQNSGVDLPIYRYADVLLMLAESINEANGAPNQDAYNAINAVRERAGLGDLSMGLSKTQFLAKIQDERLFELWGEGCRRDDLIRWNMFIQRAVNDGSSTAQSYKVLFPLPRVVITQSNGVIKQNEGYN
ncbi:RagB/SusD family nutrient uptake outer membrane protein [Chitinophaga sp. 212800010-3]|uniref:RagB/SusD family nutrient uptake outer membrane protein n=1 Tax=unclassified Chitinophaga TaxID=2619133 RepID=UPI002DEFF583|nr:RagB/SusD family nutrient uptake outer membrane protein [Chitinophaga sp. 212800010-3]